MNRPTLAVFEGDSTDGYSAFAPDFPGTGGLGDTLEEARKSLLEGISYLLEESPERFSLQGAPSGTIDFSEFDPEHTGHYVIEWINVEVAAATPAAVAA